MKPKATNPFVALAAAMRERDRAPAYKDGWRTYKEAKGELGWGELRARKFLSDGVANGSIDMWNGVEDAGDARLVRRVKYRVKK
jgi:hypothetical protein